MVRITKRKSTKPSKPVKVRYVVSRHCGEWVVKGSRRSPCLALKGEGTTHPGVGPCKLHSSVADKSSRNYYLSVRPTRLHYLLQRVRDEGSNPSDVLNELEIMRAMSIGFIEDHSELDDPEAILQATDLLTKIAKVAQQFQQIQQAEMIHIKAVEVIHVQMAKAMMELIQTVDPNLAEDWRERLIDRIKSQWGLISIETNPRELRKVLAARGQVEVESEVEG